MTQQHLARFGRNDGSATKTQFFTKRRDAVSLCNSLSMVLMGRHDFKLSECHEEVRVQDGEFWIEYKPCDAIHTH